MSDDHLRESDQHAVLSRAMAETVQVVLQRQRRNESALREVAADLQSKAVTQALALAILQATLDASSDAMIALDICGHPLAFNQAFVRLWNLDPMTMSDPDPARLWSNCSAKLSCPEQTVWPLQQPIRPIESIELRDGRVFERRISPHMIDGICTGHVQYWKEVTEKLRADALEQRYLEQLRLFSRQALQAQENERKSIAYALSEELAQALAAIKIYLELAARAEENDKSLQERNITIVESALQRVRDIAMALRPSVLDDLGLAAALRWLTEDTARRTGLSIHFEADEQLLDRADAELETLVFRIAQEALNNVERHAQALAVTVLLSCTEGELRLEVRDNGVGFEWTGFAKISDHVDRKGLLGMRERARLADAMLDIRSAPGQGCTVRLRCPWAVGSNRLIAHHVEAVALERPIASR